jgi:hypothetical protein
MRTTTTPNVPSANSMVMSTTEFCGTKKEKDNFIKAGTSSSIAYSGNVKVEQSTSTVCSIKK